MRRTDFLNVSVAAGSPEMLRVLKIPLLAGRTLTWQDAPVGQELEASEPSGRMRPVLVNPEFCRVLFHVDNCLDRTFGSGMGQPATADWRVVGMVGSMKYRHLREQQPPIMFPAIADRTDGGTLYVRTSRPAAALAADLRRIAADSGVELATVTTLDEQVEETLWQERTSAVLSALFAALALLLAATGLHGLLAFLVAARRREIGVRIAVGAQPADVVRLMARAAGRPLLMGLLAGAVLFSVSTRLIAHLLYGVQPSDPRTLAAVLLILAAMAVLAVAVPTLRAVRTNQAVCLREE